MTYDYKFFAFIGYRASLFNNAISSCYLDLRLSTITIIFIDPSLLAEHNGSEHCTKELIIYFSLFNLLFPL